MMTKLLLASNNQDKLREIRDLLSGFDIELVMPAQIGLELHVAEDGDTYAENAILKGRAFANSSGLLTMADDSGLEVEALGGAPGLYSARFSPEPGATDSDRRAYLLKQLENLPQPWTARFRCIIALVTPQGDIQLTEGICPGEVISHERGHNGFGYDPIFLIPELEKTMAELDMAQKNLLSHRARAVKSAIPFLVELGKNAGTF
jgi:XTP/dITP diphosphohydrolase